MSVVASAMAKGTRRVRARVWAKSVLPEPVGPVRIVSSPRRCPFSVLFSSGSDRNCVPCSSKGCTRS